MNRIMRLSVSTCLAMACGVSVAQAETWENVSKKIAEVSKKLNSAQYKMKMTYDVKQPQMSMKSETTGTYEFTKKGEKYLYRNEMTIKSETKFEGGEHKSNMTQHTVCDGEYIYNYTETDGVKQATKEKYTDDKMPPVDQEKAFKDMEKEYTVTVKPDETVDGRPTFVVEATPKREEMKAFTGKTVYYYCKETGLPVKMVSFSPQNEPQSTMTITDIKVNPEIKPDRFKFTPPAGVDVQDNTRG